MFLVQYFFLIICLSYHKDSKRTRRFFPATLLPYLAIPVKKAIIRNKKDIWLKQVVTPGINDTYEDMVELEKEVNSFPSNIIHKVELLPYHTLGVSKYDDLNLDYRLKTVPLLSTERLEKLKAYLHIEKLV